MGAVRRMADGGENAHWVGAVTFRECPTKRATGSSGSGGDFRHRRRGISPNAGRSPAGTTDPGGQAGNRRAAYAGQEALYKASSERGEVAGFSPGRANSPDQEWGCGWSSGGRRRSVGADADAGAGVKVLPNTA